MKILKYRKIIISFLVVIAILLLILNNSKYGIITLDKISSNAPVIDALSKIISTLLLLLGGIFSYLKFFKGVIFAERLDIQIKNNVFKYDDSSNYHLVQLLFKNAGTVSIQNIRLVSLSIKCLESKQEFHQINKDTDISPPKFNTAIYSNSSGSYSYAYIVPLANKVIQHKISLQSLRGTTWTSSFMIPNVEGYNFTNN